MIVHCPADFSDTVTLQHLTMYSDAYHVKSVVGYLDISLISGGRLKVHFIHAVKLLPVTGRTTLQLPITLNL